MLYYLTFSPKIGQFDMLVKAHSKEWALALTTPLLTVILNLLASIPEENEQNSQDNRCYIEKSHLGGGLLHSVV